MDYHKEVLVLILRHHQEHALKNQINGNYMRGDDPNSIQQSLQRSVAEVGFGGDPKLADEAFREIAELPDNFARASLTALTASALTSIFDRSNFDHFP